MTKGKGKGKPVSRNNKSKKDTKVYTNPDQYLQAIDFNDALGDYFGIYSKYVIQSRSLPDSRDGLIPVQRRTLYSMDETGFNNNKKYVKSAKPVGNVMGEYHPHGDSSIYGALARMSKPWVMGIPMIDFSGNNGSIDGDNPAAMRYTEVRLSKYSEDILLSNLKLKGIVPEVFNYDDTKKEPVYLPSKLPNILINGSDGIGVGFASNVLPFNIVEVLEACIQALENPNIEDIDIAKIINAPDFPTGGLIADYKSYTDVLLEGRGAFKVRGNYTLEEDKENKVINIVFSDIPYGSLKPKITDTIHEAIQNKEVSGIIEARDSSSAREIVYVVECKEDANIDAILSYLFTKTDLQTNVALNTTVIHEGKPQQLGIPTVIKEFNKFRFDNIVRGLQIQIRDESALLHINLGFKIMVDNLEEIVEIIKNSETKKESRDKIMPKFGLSEIQANRILELQLYRVNKSDMEKYNNLIEQYQKSIAHKQMILSKDEYITQAMIQAYKSLQETYDIPRKTILKEELEVWDYKPELIVQKENVVVGITKDGFIKVSNMRSYKTSTVDNSDMAYIFETDTRQNLMFVIDNGQYAYTPIHRLPLSKWSDAPKHLSTFGLDTGASEIVFATMYNGLDKDKNLFLIKDSGVGRQASMLSYVKTQGFNKMTVGSKCSKDEKIIGGMLLDTTIKNYIALMDNLYANMYFDAEEMPLTGVRGMGSSAMKINKKQDRYITEFAVFHNKENIPEFCEYRERGKAGWNRAKKDGKVSIYAHIKKLEESEQEESTEEIEEK